MTKKLKTVSILAAATAFAGLGGIASAQGSGAVTNGISQGVVGETVSGYLGFAQTPSAELRAQVDQINIGRRSAYARLAQERGVTRQQVAQETACRQLGRVDPGEAYQLEDGVWRTRGSAPVNLPSYC